MTPGSPDDDGAPAVRRRVLVLLNPHAGRRRSLTRAQARLRTHPGLALDLVVPDPADHAAQLAAGRTALADGVDAVVVRGGDGMVAARVGLVCDHAEATGRRVPLGIVPAGTGNDLARAAGLHRRDPGAALEAVLRALEDPAAPVRRIDALRLTVTRAGAVVERRWAANSVNIGFDARVNARANALGAVPGPLRYLAALGLEARAFAAVEMGLGPLPTAGLALLFPLVYVRAHRLLRPLCTERARRVRVAVPDGVPVYADGDEVLPASHGGAAVEVEAVPGAVALLG